MTIVLSSTNARALQEKDGAFVRDLNMAYYDAHLMRSTSTVETT
jgi:hypothetical protein